MVAKCDGCGGTDGVRRAFVTVWNGNIFDLCKKCAEPLGKLLDALWFGKAP